MVVDNQIIKELRMKTNPLAIIQQYQEGMTSGSSEWENRLSRARKTIIKKDLCGESLRLCTIILKKEQYRCGNI